MFISSDKSRFPVVLQKLHISDEITQTEIMCNGGDDLFQSERPPSSHTSYNNNIIWKVLDQRLRCH